MIRVRQADANDLVWIVDVANIRYPDFDIVAAYEWGVARLGNPRVFLRRTDNLFMLAVSQPEFWSPDQLRAAIILFAGDGQAKAGQIRAILRSVISWAAELGCADLSFDPATMVDFSKVCRVLGFKQVPRFVLDLKD